MTLRVVVAAAALCLNSGCVLVVRGLAPKPNVVHAIVTPKEKVALKLGDSIQDKFPIRLEGGTVEFETFREDIKAGFGNGFASYFEISSEPDLVLEISDAEPSFQCFAYVGCKAMLKFKGVVVNGRTREANPFAGRVGSEVYQGQEAFANASKEVIERMFEEISTVLGSPKSMGNPPPAEKSTKL